MFSLPRLRPRPSAEAVTVAAADGPVGRRAFVELPYRLYRDDPHWVPPLRGDCRRLLNRRRNPFFAYGDTALFLARRAGTVVGRIAAVRNRRHEERNAPGEGFFGQFECANDSEAAAALVDAAADWLRDQGLTSMTGPVNFTTNDECGTLVEGFGSPPAIMTAHTPPYHAELLTACGFAKARDLWSWEWSADVQGLPERFARVARVCERRGGVRIRAADLGDFDAEVARIRDLYHEILGANWGFQPMSEREFGHVAHRLRPWLHPELVSVAEAGGRPVGLLLAVPDANQAVAAARGSLTPLGLARVLRAARSIGRARLVVLGVTPDHRNRGIEAALIARLYEGLRARGLHSAEFSWTLEDNRAVNNLLEIAGCRRTRVHRIWRREL